MKKSTLYDFVKQKESAPRDFLIQESLRPVIYCVQKMAAFLTGPVSNKFFRLPKYRVSRFELPIFEFSAMEKLGHIS